MWMHFYKNKCFKIYRQNFALKMSIAESARYNVSIHYSFLKKEEEKEEELEKEEE